MNSYYHDHRMKCLVISWLASLRPSVYPDDLKAVTQKHNLTDIFQIYICVDILYVNWSKL